MFNAEQPAYKSLREVCAERTVRLAIWAGSGLSQPAGLPSWAELRKHLEVAAESKIGTLAPADTENIEAKLSAARKQDNPWRAFKLLEDALGPGSYRGIIRERLDPGDRLAPPSAYSKLWRLNIGGFLNLNLDSFASRAFGDVFPTKHLINFYGQKAGDYFHTLESHRPFVANLHGMTADASSWVFTYPQLKRLLADKGYKQYIAACAAKHTLVFMGITADDESVGGHLQHLLESGIDIGTAYWITHRDDIRTDEWAEKHQIRVIRYKAPDNKHTELDQLLDDLLSYVPQDKPAFPVAIPTTVKTGELPDDLTLSNRTEEEIRKALNARAASILEPHTREAQEQYTLFCKQYERSIHRAWFCSTSEPNNVLMGYRLNKEIGKGAFGRVYQATAQSGEKVAVKVLHQDARDNAEVIGCFRRGVRSMRILSEQSVEGMVPYREASEIPAFAVMDLIDGPNLKEAVESRYITEWRDILKIAIDLTHTIRSAHLLPQRVLHRDIRPPNIMLKDYWSSPMAFEVVVLDFDLSWHRDATEKSVVFPASVNGFIAPEQLIEMKDVSTRNAAVDSFGLGMTFFYLVTGLTPRVGQHRERAWVSHVRNSMKEKPCKPWHSLPQRMAGLVMASTKDRQSDRWDLSQIESELIRIKNALEKPNDVSSSELYLEELMSSAATGTDRTWQENIPGFEFSLPGGGDCKLQADEGPGMINLKLRWEDEGTLPRKNVGKWLPAAIRRAAALLSKGGWGTNEPSTNPQSAFLTASISVEVLRKQFDRSVRAFDEAVDALSFT